MSTIDDDEIVQAFLEESRENLDQLDLDLVALELHPSDPDLLARVFRTIHTIKGTCGFLGYHRLEALTHAGENLLGALRAGELALDREVTTTLLRLVDSVREVLVGIAANGSEGEDDHAAVRLAVEAHLAHTAPGPPPAPPSAASAPPPPPAPTPDGAGETETSVRVDVSVLDRLMDLIGELVLARSQIGDLVGADDDGPLTAPYRRLRLVTGELQEGVMLARLQPVGSVTGKFRRIVRDLAHALGKQIRVDIEGEDVGVDKAVNEALRDPLLHLVRNAVDHGIESPAERAAAGKPPEAVLSIRAFHESGRVHLEVADDGRGIDRAGLVARAVAEGAITAEAGAALSPTEAMGLVFRPGLSTSATVTSLSGRGVGMDIVRASLAQVGGSVDVESEAGVGTVFRLSVPLTLAIMPALIVFCGGGRYAVPQVDVQEVVSVSEEDAAVVVHDVDGTLLHRLRGRLLPLVDLAAVLGVKGERATHPNSAGPTTVVVVGTYGHRFGLMVDDVGDTTEAVVKPLTRATRDVPTFAGVTLLGDGRASLILDVAGVAAAAGLTRTDEDQADESEDPTSFEETSSLILATGNDGAALAVQLDTVRRLELFQAEAVERSGGREVVQYGDLILPLVRVDAALTQDADKSRPEQSVLQAVVCDTAVGAVGLVVGRIDDIVVAPAVTTEGASRRGVSASMVVAGRVTEVLDVETLAADAEAGRLR